MTDLTDRFLRWLERRRGVSFVEVERWLTEQGVNPEGNYALEPIPNLVVWAGVSNEFCDFIDAIKPHVDMQPLAGLEAFLVYACDGKALTLPLAQKPPRDGYKNPHWAPCVINPKVTKP